MSKDDEIRVLKALEQLLASAVALMAGDPILESWVASGVADAREAVSQAVRKLEHER